MSSPPSSPDLRTRWLGLELASPLVASASPLTGSVEGLVRLQAAGAAAAVLPSLFEEQIEHEELVLAGLQDLGAESFAEALDYFPELGGYNTGPERYLHLVAEAKDALAIPVIASLNGRSTGGWVRWARRVQEAGADALELNAYVVPLDPDEDAAAVERRYLDLVEAVRAAVDLPLAVKVGPYFSSFAHFARRLVDAGADGLVLFNRFLMPRIDPDGPSIGPSLELSTPWEAGLALQWIGTLAGRVKASLGATGGLHGAREVAELLLAGADVCMLASALLANGPERLGAVRADLAAWMAEREYASVEQLKGSMSRANCTDPRAYERLNYMRALVSWSIQSRTP